MDMNVVLNAIKAEMKPSMGCTEPVAIALAVSRTCQELAAPAEKLDMVISSNILVVFLSKLSNCLIISFGSSILNLANLRHFLTLEF